MPNFALIGERVRVHDEPSKIPTSVKLVSKYYKLAVAKCRVLIRNYQIKNERQVIEANNAGAFYKFLNKTFSCKSRVGGVWDANSNLVTDDRQRHNS